MHTGSFAASGTQITCVAVSPCSKWVIRGTAQGQVFATHIASPTQPHQAPAHPRRWQSAGLPHHELVFNYHIGPVTALAVNTAGWVATGGQDCSVHVFPLLASVSAPVAAQHFVFHEHSLPITDLRLQDSGRLFSASKDQTCRVFDVFSSVQLASISFPSSLTCLAVPCLEDAVFVGATDGAVYRADLWKLAHHQIVSADATGPAAKRHALAVFSHASDQGPLASVTSVAVSSDGARVAVGFSSGMLSVWESHSGQRLFSLQHCKTAVVRAFFAQASTENGHSACAAFPKEFGEKSTSVALQLTCRG